MPCNKYYPCDISHCSWSFPAYFSQLKDHWKILFCLRKLDWFLTDASNFRIIASEIKVINSSTAFIRRGIQVEGGKEKQLRLPNCLTGGAGKREELIFQGTASQDSSGTNVFQQSMNFVVPQCYSSRGTTTPRFEIHLHTQDPPIRIVLLQLVLNRTVPDVWRRDQLLIKHSFHCTSIGSHSQEL